MRFEIVRRPQAIRDIEESFVFIAEDNLEAGFRFLEAVENSIVRLAEFPYIGTLKDFGNERLQGLRFWPVTGFENYIIYYRVDESIIDLFRLIHTGRDTYEIFNS